MNLALSVWCGRFWGCKMRCMVDGMYGWRRWWDGRFRESRGEFGVWVESRAWSGTAEARLGRGIGGGGMVWYGTRERWRWLVSIGVWFSGYPSSILPFFFTFSILFCQIDRFFFLFFARGFRVISFSERLVSTHVVCGLTVGPRTRWVLVLRTSVW